MKKADLPGDNYMVLVNNEFAGWFNIPVGDSRTRILRAALSSNPTIIDMSEISLDIEDLPEQAKGYMWDGKGFIKE